MEEIKHGGCTDCGSKTELTLMSIKTPKGSHAFCSQCLPKCEVKY
jgi:hypothetical protein